ncbi:electron transport complex subunit RsxG, partial [Salmonella enterica subsp. enterica serovar Kentucky]
QVLPPVRYNNNLQESCYLVDAPALGTGTHRVFIARKADKPVAAIIVATARDGSSGAIQVIVGADSNGTVRGTRVPVHAERRG